MTTQVTDVLDAVQSFVAKGYDREYRVKDGALVDLELGSTLDACSIRVDAALRLESGDGAEDASNIYAITDPATEQTESQPQDETEPEEHEPPKRRQVKKTRGRASVPSWDEIMFGGGKD